MIGGIFKREFYKSVYERRWTTMSFGRFVCIYGIGYVTMMVVATLTTSIYLYRTYRDLWVCVIERVYSKENDISWMLILVGFVCTVLLWPVAIPYNLVSIVHDCEAEYKKHYL